MGRKQEAPDKLAEKLLAVRLVLNLSQTDMYAALYPELDPAIAEKRRTMIYAFEKGTRTPSIIELLKYVKVLRKRRSYWITMEDLVDDSHELWF